MELEELIFNDKFLIDLSQFHVTQKEMNELVAASIAWLSSIGMPRPDSPAAKSVGCFEKVLRSEAREQKCLAVAVYML